MFHQRWFKVIIGIATLLVVLLTTGTIYQSNATAHDMALYPAPGELIAVDGSDMHIYCVGEGSPTVIFEAGLGGTYMDWVLVQPIIGEQTRACTYDRSGMGYSDFVGASMDTDMIARRLYQLLNAAQVEGPFVLVGHSIGGIHVRSFYEMHPEDVVGMVLIDSSHENQGQYLPEPPVIVDMFYTVAPFLARIGALRFLRIANQNIVTNDLTHEQIAQTSALYNRLDFWLALQTENQMAIADTSQQGAPSSMGDLPLIVISQDVAGMEANEPEMANLWLELQGELAMLSTESTHVVAENSGHYVHYDRPQIVIDNILSMLQTLQGSQPRAAHQA